MDTQRLRLLTGGLLAVLFSFSSNAEITLDGSLSPSSGAIPLGADNQFEIREDMGRTVGSNLFHSFGTFNVGAGETAAFAGTGAIDNILSRVTGGTVSSIDGTLRTDFANATPNLFLLNPAGVVFGPNASLDVQGSFHVSTADYLRLEDGSRFNSLPAAGQILTTAPPEAFGFLGDNPADISVAGDIGSVLEVPQRESLSLVGGDISIENGALFAPGGRVNVTSMASPGEVALNPSLLGLESFDRMGEIRISRDPRIPRIGIGPTEVIADIDVSEDTAGEVFIRGGHLVLENAVIASDTGSGDAGGISIGLKGDLNIASSQSNFGSTDGGRIGSITAGAGKSGDLVVEADNILLKGDDSDSFNGLTTQSQSTGDAGDLSVTATSVEVRDAAEISAAAFGAGQAGDITVTAKSLEVRNGAVIATSTLGPGQGGNLEVKADNVLMSGDGAGVDTGLTARSFGTGDAGDLAVAAGSLDVRDGASIEASTFGAGQGGNVSIEADNISMSGGASELLTGVSTASAGTGNAGDLNLEADSLEVVNGAEIGAGTFGAGQGGKLTVNADSILLSRDRSDSFTGLSTQSASLSSGADAGDLTVTAKSLQVRNGGAITANTFGPGQGGNIKVEADRISLSGDGSEFFTRLTATAEADSTGDAGSLTIDVGELEVRNGSEISTKTFGAGRAGTIMVDADSILLSGDRAELFTGLAVGTEPSSTGKAGELKLTSGRLEVRNGAEIDASTLDVGQGGNITIEADSVLVTREGLDDGFTAITARAGVGVTGDAGSISIKTTDLKMENGTVMSTETFGSGNAGDFAIEADALVLSGNEIVGPSIDSGAFPFSEGDAGNLMIKTGQLEVRQGSQISASTLGEGQGGNLTVEADTILLSRDASSFSTGLFAKTTSGRNGGDLNVTTGNLEVRNGAEISTNTSGSGASGNLRVDADTVLLSGDGSEYVTGISNDVLGIGDAGTLTINASELDVRQGAVISANNFGAGVGGDIFVESDSIRLSRDEAAITGILARAEPSSTGNTGNLTVKSSDLDVRDGAVISTSNFSSGEGGELFVDAESIFLSGDGAAFETGIINDANGAGVPGNLTINAQNLQIRDGAVISASTSGPADGGRLNVNGESIMLSGDGARRFTGIVVGTEAANTGDAGTLSVNAKNLEVRDGATISTSTISNGGGGSLVVGAETILLSGDSSNLFTGISSQANSGSTGDAGNLMLSANSLSVRDGADISSATFGTGQGGNIMIEADDIVLARQEAGVVTGIIASAWEGTTGDAGSIEINTESLDVRDGAVVGARTFGIGQGGDISVDANTLLLSGDGSTYRTGIIARSEQGSDGNAGDLSINAGNLSVRNGAIISASTLGEGQAGDIIVNADEILLSREEAAFVTGIRNSAAPNSMGDAGSLTINAHNMEVYNGADIAVSTFGAGRGGNLSLEADNLVMSGDGATYFTGITSQAAPDSTGDAGNLAIRADSIKLRNKAEISASTAGAGRAGNMSIVADDIVLNQAGFSAFSDTESSSDSDVAGATAGNVFITANSSLSLVNGSTITVETNGANAGDIGINAQNLLRLSDSSITTSVANGEGNGGNISIDPTFVVLDDSAIVANAGQGRGGNIDIVANFFFQSPESIVDASSEAGIDGTVDIVSPDTNISGSIAVLPETYVNAVDQLSERCGARIANRNSFVVKGRGSVPLKPEDFSPATSLGDGDDRELSDNAAAAPGGNRRDDKLRGEASTLMIPNERHPSLVSQGVGCGQQ